MCSVEHTQASLTGSGVLIVSSVCRPACMQKLHGQHANENEIASIFISSCKTTWCAPVLCAECTIQPGGAEVRLCDLSIQVAQCQQVPLSIE